MTTLAQLSSSQLSPEIIVNQNFEITALAAAFGYKYSTTSGNTWGYYGGYHLVNGVPTLVADGTITLKTGKTQQIEAGFVSTTTYNISAISLANPCVITIGAHPINIGDTVWIAGITGTTQLNNNWAKVTAIAATTITINVDTSSGYTAWSSGGTVAVMMQGGTTALKIGTGVDIGNAFVAQFPLYSATHDGDYISAYTDYRVTNRPITGLLSLSVAGAANVVLTAQQAQNQILEFTGLLTGNILVLVPPVFRQWTVFNNTTGAFTLTVQTPSGTGIAVGQGFRAILYSDGTNVVRVTADT